jgi:hypothetical protein
MPRAAYFAAFGAAFAALALALAPAASGQQDAEPDPCAYDRDAMMALDQQAFDQDVPFGGWRGLDERGCHAAAADLIADWRRTNADRITDAEILYWHEGQMRASAGDYDGAIPLFTQARREVIRPDRAETDQAWNAYADATIAFLERDRAAFEAARERLLAIPEPEGWAEIVAGADERVRAAMAWPMNLSAVDMLRNCFERTYDEAYSRPECRTP